MPKKKRVVSKGSKISQQKLTPEEGVAALGFITMFADEEVSDEEAEALAEMLLGIEIFQEYSEEDVDAMLEKFIAIGDEEGYDTLVNTALEALPNEEYREITYITAMVVLAVDEEVPDEEQEYLDGLQAALGISDDRAEELCSALFDEEEDDEEE